MRVFQSAEGVIVSEPYAFHRGLSVGDRIELPTPSGVEEIPILGVFYDYGSDRGAVMMSRRLYDRLFDDPGVTSLGLFLAPGADSEAVVRDLLASVPERRTVIARSNDSLRAASLEVFDRTFEVTAVLRLLAFIVAFVGVLSALMALELERAREFGVLRASGLTPGQVWTLVMTQTGLMGLNCGRPRGADGDRALRRHDLRDQQEIVRMDAGHADRFGRDRSGGRTGAGRGVIGRALPRVADVTHVARRRAAERMKRSVGVVGAVTLLLGCSGEEERPGQAHLSLVETLAGADTVGYARAMEPRPFDFPRDHGPHPRFRTEWWYVTGNLTSTAGRDFGFQFTIFRNALSPGPRRPTRGGGPTRHTWRTSP